MNGLWSIQTMEYYAVIKTNELLSYKETWGDLESMLQVEDI